MCACPTTRVSPSWSSLHICLRGFCVATFKQAFLLLLSTFWPGAPHHQTFCRSPFPSIFSAKAGVPDHPLGSLARGLLGSAEGGCRSDPAAMPAMPVTGLFSTCFLATRAPTGRQQAGGLPARDAPCVARWATSPARLVCPLAASPSLLAGAWERARKLGLSWKVKRGGEREIIAEPRGVGL